MKNWSAFVLGIAFLVAGLNADRLPLGEGQGGSLVVCGGVLIVLGLLRLYMAKLIGEDRPDRRL